jgi:hypothetical protein
MSLALAEAAGRYGHVMFPSNLHPPAVQLSQYLLEKGPGRGWANRVFYSGTQINATCFIWNAYIRKIFKYVLYPFYLTSRLRTPHSTYLTLNTVYFQMTGLPEWKLPLKWHYGYGIYGIKKG